MSRRPLKRPAIPRATLEQHQKILETLGPMPAETLEAMTDYGMSEGDIARYFRLTAPTVRRLKRALWRRDQ